MLDAYRSYRALSKPDKPLMEACWDQARELAPEGVVEVRGLSGALGGLLELLGDLADPATSDAHSFGDLRECPVGV